MPRPLLTFTDVWKTYGHGEAQVHALAGVDFAIADKGALRVDVRWIDIDSDVKLDGTKLGTVKIDPLAYGVSYVFKF